MSSRECADGEGIIRGRGLMAAVTYTGPTDQLIADGTNPWVEVDGIPVDWLDASPLPPVWTDCETCSGTPMPGVIAPMDTAEGVQRCDICDLFDGDLSAANALARAVSGVTRFEAAENSLALTMYTRRPIP
jgi:hypothetical protein